MMNPTINLITRVSIDKNFFSEFVLAVHLLREKYSQNITLNFVGGIESNSVLFDTTRLIKILNLENSVSFTKKSIRFNDMDEEMLNGYFVNYCIGDFVGYSSIESVDAGLKTFFYNIDHRAINKKYSTLITFCNNHLELVEFMASLCQRNIDETIRKENEIFRNDFFLTNIEKKLLLGLM